MPIIARVPNIPFHSIPTTWDENRVDVVNAPYKGAPKLAKDAISATLLTGAKEDIVNAAEAHKKVLDNHVRRKIPKPLDEAIEMAKRKYDALVRQGAPDSERDAADAEWRAALRRKQIYEKFVVDYPSTVADLAWPTIANMTGTSSTYKVKIAFGSQFQVAQSTGFQISKGYVMTAEHCVRGNWWGKRAVFNLRTTAEPGDNIEAQRKGVKGDSVHDIKRVVLRTNTKPQSYLSLTKWVGSNLFDHIDWHDVAIIELESSSSHPFPSSTVNLSRERPEVKTNPEPLCALGHSFGSPLKYSGAAKGQGTAPGVVAAPPNAAHRSLYPCIAADIDVFTGNSGGPLIKVDSLRTDDTPAEAIGVCSYGLTVTTPDQVQRPPGKLHKSVNDWLRKAYKEAGWALPAIERDLDRLNSPLGSFYANDNNDVTLQQMLPGDSSIKNSILFNRADLFWPFTVPVPTFLSNGGFAVRVDIEIVITTLHKNFALQPRVTFCDSKAQSRTLTLGTESRIPVPAAVPSFFRWTRTFRSVDDINATFKSDQKTFGYGDIPNELFTQPSGFCSWDQLTFAVPRMNTRDVSGMVNIVFGYNRDDPSDAIQFTNELDIRPIPNTSDFVGFLGERDVRIKKDRGEPILAGDPWGAPTKAYLDVNEDPLERVYQ